MSSSYSPCAACKFLRRKCTQECVFAPYFPPDQPQRFANVHKVFGASNISKLLHDLNPNQRQDAVNSLVYEAESRLHDPIYGCVGLISIMQKRLKQLQSDIYHAKKELATYIGPSAMLPMFPNPMGRTLMGVQGGPVPGPGVGVGPPQVHQQQEVQQLLDAQQLAALATVGARDEQEIMMSYLEQQQLQHQQQQHQQQLLFGGGEEGYHQVGPSLGLGVTTYDVNNYHQMEQQQQQDHEQHGEPLLLLQQLNTVAPRQQQQQEQDDEQKGPLLVLQQPDTVTLQQHGLGDMSQGIIHQHMQLHQQGSGNMSHHHLIIQHNQQFQRSASTEEEEDNTAGPSY